MSSIETTVDVSSATPGEQRDAEAQLKRGAFLNTITLLLVTSRGIFTFLVARLLGPAVLGRFSVALATIDLLSKVGILGLDDAITTFIARADALGDRIRSRFLFRLAVSVAIVQSLVVTFLLIVMVRISGVGFGLPAETVSSLAVLLWAIPGIALYRVSNGVSRGLKIMQHDTYSRGITESLAITLAFVIAVALGLRAFAPEVATIIGSTASGLTAFTLAARLFRKLPEQNGSFSVAAETRQLLAYALPISGYQLLNTFILRLDLIMLGWFVGRAPGVSLATVGIYAVVINIATGLRKVNHAFNPIFAPVIAGMTATGNQEYAVATYARLAQWMLWILLPIVAVMTFAGETILGIFGPAFRQGSVWLIVAAIACATDAFVGLGETVIMVQRPRLNLLNSCISCAIAALANLWLIPRFGVLGAAFGLLVPYTVQGILRSVALRLLFHWHPRWTSLMPPVIVLAAALPPAIFCRFMLKGVAGQIAAAATLVAIFWLSWKHYRSRELSS